MSHYNNIAVNGSNEEVDEWNKNVSERNKQQSSFVSHLRKYLNLQLCKAMFWGGLSGTLLIFALIASIKLLGREILPLAQKHHWSVTKNLQAFCDRGLETVGWMLVAFGGTVLGVINVGRYFYHSKQNEINELLSSRANCAITSASETLPDNVYVDYRNKGISACPTCPSAISEDQLTADNSALIEP